MSELIRDTVFGHFVRLITNGRMLQYAEERDPTLWKQYLDREQTMNMALHGNTEGPPSEEKLERDDTRVSSEESSQTQVANGHQREQQEHQLSSTITGQRIDTEKGRDITMVTWYGDNDPEVRISRGLETNWNWTDKDRCH